MAIINITSTLEMVGFLKTNGTSCRFVSLLSVTVPKLKKTCPYPGVKKVSQKVGLVNANYNTSVRRRIAEKLGVELKDATYENGNVWYQHLTQDDGKPLPVVVNKTKNDGKHYLQFFPHKSNSHYIGENGEKIADELIEPHLYARSETPDFKPCVIAIALDNVKELKASGIIIHAEDYETAAASVS